MTLSGVREAGAVIEAWQDYCRKAGVRFGDADQMLDLAHLAISALDKHRRNAEQEPDE